MGDTRDGGRTNGERPRRAGKHSGRSGRAYKCGRRSGRADRMSYSLALRNNKLRFMGAMLSLVFVGLSARVVYFKTVHGADFEQRAILQEYNLKNSETVLPAMRGDIVDRNRQSLAESVVTYNLVLDVRKLITDTQTVKVKAADGTTSKRPVMDYTLGALRDICGIPIETLKGYVAVDHATGKPVNDTDYFIFARDVGADKARAIKNSGLPHVYLDQGYKLNFPHDSLAAQVIGFVHGDASFGLENQYKTELEGTPGKALRTFDSTGLIQDTQVPPVDGYTLVTTLDMFMQQFAEQAVQEAVDAYNPQNASAIIMNPKTGEVLAMAQSPTFDLNDPADPAKITGRAPDAPGGAKAPAAAGGQPQADDRPQADQLLMDRLNNAWTNFNITKTFEPGSIFKPFIMAAALEEGAISLDDTFTCYGSMVVPGTSQRLNCWQLSGHGKETLTEILAHSCDVAMIQVGMKLGRYMYYKYQHDFGFGDYTGIDLPNEASSGSAALMPTLSQLGPVELATGTYGQGFNATPLQDINAFSALINGGDLMQPYVVSQIIDKNGNIVSENKPEAVRKVISKRTSDFMRQAMVSVIQPNSKDCTGFRAYIAGYDIGGKTGTAQQGKRSLNKYALSFIAYLPADDPQVVCMLSIDIPQEYVDGVTSPGYAMRDMLVNIIKYKGFRPSGPVSPEDDLQPGAGDVTVRNYVSMPVADAVKSLIQDGMNYEIIGNGDTVSAQIPMSGSQITKDTKIFITLTSSQGAKLITVPQVTGLPIEIATGSVKSQGLDVYTIKQEIVSGAADGAVSGAGQAAAGARDTSGTAQTAPDTPAAPDAAAAPPDAPPNNADNPAPDNPVGIQTGVVSQVPLSGAQVPPGTAVKLIYR